MTRLDPETLEQARVLAAERGIGLERAMVELQSPDILAIQSAQFAAAGVPSPAQQQWDRLREVFEQIATALTEAFEAFERTLATVAEELGPLLERLAEWVDGDEQRPPRDERGSWKALRATHDMEARLVGKRLPPLRLAPVPPAHFRR